MITFIEKLGMKKTCLNIVKAKCGKSIANIMSKEEDQTFPSRVLNIIKMFTPSTLKNIQIEVLAKAHGPR